MARNYTTGWHNHSEETRETAKIFRSPTTCQMPGEKAGAELPHSKLEDFLAEAGEDEFDAEESSAVVLVEDGVDFDDFEGNHGLGVGNHFHGKVRFAIGNAAAHGSAHAGGIGGIDKIH